MSLAKADSVRNTIWNITDIKVCQPENTARLLLQGTDELILLK